MDQEWEESVQKIMLLANNTYHNIQQSTLMGGFEMRIKLINRT